MDISAALAPKSDQLDAVDLLGSPPLVFTITDVNAGSDEQPVNIHLAEFPRVWRPSKGMLRVLAHCWGKDVKLWIGRKVELYTDPDVMFGKAKVGGIRIQRLSHIDSRKSVPMIVGRGKSGSWNVDPLPDATPAKDWDAVMATAAGLTDIDALGELWKREQVGSAPEAVKAAIVARVDEVKAAAVDVSPEDAFPADAKAGA